MVNQHYSDVHACEHTSCHPYIHTYIHIYGQTPEGSAVAKCGSYYPECDCDADVVQSLNIALIYKKTCSLHLISFK